MILLARNECWNDDESRRGGGGPNTVNQSVEDAISTTLGG